MSQKSRAYVIALLQKAFNSGLGTNKVNQAKISQIAKNIELGLFKEFGISSVNNLSSYKTKVISIKETLMA